MDSPTAEPEGIAIICSWAVSLGLRLKAADITNAYFQGKPRARPRACFFADFVGVCTEPIQTLLAVRCRSTVEGFRSRPSSCDPRSIYCPCELLHWCRSSSMRLLYSAGDIDERSVNPLSQRREIWSADPWLRMKLRCSTTNPCPHFRHGHPQRKSPAALHPNVLASSKRSNQSSQLDCGSTAQTRFSSVYSAI